MKNAAWWHAALLRAVGRWARRVGKRRRRDRRRWLRDGLAILRERGA